MPTRFAVNPQRKSGKNPDAWTKKISSAKAEDFLLFEKTRLFVFFSFCYFRLDKLFHARGRKMRQLFFNKFSRRFFGGQRGNARFPAAGNRRIPGRFLSDSAQIDYSAGFLFTQRTNRFVLPDITAILVRVRIFFLRFQRTADFMTAGKSADTAGFWGYCLLHLY